MYSNVTEKVILEQLYGILTNSNFCLDAHLGFRKGCSTSKSLNNFLNGIYEDMEDKRGCGVFFLDFRKAFDTMDQTLLLDKMQILGLKHSMV